MGRIQLSDGTVKDDQRTNTRLRLSFNDWTKIISITVTIIISGTILKMNVSANCKEIDKIKQEDKEDDAERREIQQDVTVLKQDVKNIKETVERIERNQKEFQREQNNLINQVLLAIRK